MKKLTVVIVNYNVKHYVEQCLHSVERAIEGLDAEVVVVDNHSHDDSVTYLQERFPWVNIIANNHNSGFSRANNMAIRQTQGEYVLLLNPDTIVGENVLRACITFMDEHPDAGALGVQMLKTNGEKARESRRGLPTPMTAFYKVCGLCDAFPESKRFGKYYMGYLPWDEASEIEIVSGAYCMVRRAALDQVGLLDEDFFMYGEDIDLSYRILKGNYHNWYIPVRILHYKGESTQKSSFRYVHVFYDAMLIFFRKHFGHMTFLLSIPIKAAIYFKALIALLQMSTQRIRKMLGFTERKRGDKSYYLFIGHQQHLDDCRKQATVKGLDAGFLVGDETTLPQGHLDQLEELKKKDCVYVVYDTEAYRYQTMLNIMEAQNVEHISLGTYSPQTGMLITEEEVM